MKRIFGFVGGLLLTLSAQAADVTWFEVEPHFTYVDLHTNCKSGMFPTKLYLALEHTAGQVHKAVLSNGTTGILVNRHRLTADETAQIRLHTDPTGRIWVHELSLGPATLNWILFKADGLGECRPGQPLATIGPVPHVYAYPLAGLGLSLSYVSSPPKKFTGTLQDGGSYEFVLRLTQSRFSMGAKRASDVGR